MKSLSTRVKAGLVVALLAAGSAGIIACGGTVKRPDGGVGLLPTGASAPDVVGQVATGQDVRLSSLRGKAVVVYFYPQDETPGCTKEACAFRDAWKDLAKNDVAVFGVSVNSAERHRAFQKTHELPFPLVADEGGSVAEAYGVRHHLWGYDRVTFLIGKDGRVARVWPDVDPAVHAREVIDAAAKL